MYMRNLWPSNVLPDPGGLIRDLERMIDTVSRNAGTDSRQGSFPPLNVSRDEDRYTVRAVLPGIEPEKLQVSVERNKVTIAGERVIPPEHAPASDRDGKKAVSYHRKERAEGSFSRTITLDALFDTEQVAATYRDGILTIALPLTNAAKPRVVPVQTNRAMTRDG